jgi:hypothetical protein
MERKEFTINNEGEFNQFIRKLKDDGKITEEERRVMSDYVCGIFDALDGIYDIEEEDLL